MWLRIWSLGGYCDLLAKKTIYAFTVREHHMVTSGIDRICISVRNMDESLSFFRDFVGMHVIDDQPLDPSAIQKLWNLDKDTTARAVYLKNQQQPTLVQLIEFQPVTGKSIREGSDT